MEYGKEDRLEVLRIQILQYSAAAQKMERDLEHTRRQLLILTEEHDVLEKTEA